MHSVIPVRTKPHPLLIWWYFGSIAYAALAFGGTDAFTQSLIALSLSIMWLVSAGRLPRNERLFRLYALAALCLCLLAGLALLQSLRFEHNPLEHPLWKVARDYAGPVAGAISVAPERTRAALVAFAPLIALLLAFVIFEDLHDALTMLKRLSYFSATLALYGIIQHLFLPLQLGFGAKTFDLDSLTAFFVNRNSAGTFFGAGMLLSLSLAFYYLRSIDPAKLGEKLLRYPASDGAHAYYRFAIFASFALLQATALFLTKSRGATGASFIAIVVFIILMAKHKLARGQTLDSSRSYGAGRSRGGPGASCHRGFLPFCGTGILSSGRSRGRLFALMRVPIRDRGDLRQLAIRRRLWRVFRCLPRLSRQRLRGRRERVGGRS